MILEDAGRDGDGHQLWRQVSPSVIDADLAEVQAETARQKVIWAETLDYLAER